MGKINRKDTPIVDDEITPSLPDDPKPPEPSYSNLNVSAKPGSKADPSVADYVDPKSKTDKLKAAFDKAGVNPETKDESDPNGPRYQRPPMAKTEDTTPSPDGHRPKDQSISGDLKYDPNAFEKKLDTFSRPKSRADELQGVLDEYNRVSTESNQRRKNAAQTAATLRDDDGRAYYAPFADAADKAQATLGERQKYGDNQIKFMADRERNDPNSEVSRQTTEAVNKMFGMKIPLGVISAAEHDKFFQIPKTYQGNVVKEEIANDNNVTKKDIKDKDRASAEGRAQNHELHSDQRTDKVVGGMLGRSRMDNDTRLLEKALEGDQGRGNSRGDTQYKSSVEYRIQNITPSIRNQLGLAPELKHFVPNKLQAPSPTEEHEMNDIINTSERMEGDLSKIQSIMDKQRNDPSFIPDMDEIAGIQTNLMQAYEDNTKANKNGVMNFGDLAAAKEFIGNPAAWWDYATKHYYSSRKIAQAKESIARSFEAGMNAKKYHPATDEEAAQYLKDNGIDRASGGVTGSPPARGRKNDFTDEQAAELAKRSGLTAPAPRGGKMPAPEPKGKGMTADEFLKKHGKKAK